LTSLDPGWASLMPSESSDLEIDLPKIHLHLAGLMAQHLEEDLGPTLQDLAMGPSVGLLD